MPDAAEVRLVFRLFDDRHHVRIVRQRLRERIDLAVTELRGERRQRGRVESLVTQREDVMFEERGADRVDSGRVDRPDVDTGYVCAERAVHPPDQHGASPATVMRCIRRCCGKKSFTGLCCVARLSQITSVSGAQFRRTVNSSVVTCLNSISSNARLSLPLSPLIRTVNNELT